MTTEENTAFSFDWEDDEPDDQKIRFHSEDIDFEPGAHPLLIRWIESIIEAENKQLVFLNFIFCSDDYLHKLNLEYLDHDTLTDIITFPYADLPLIQGDVFISIDRVNENATEYGVPFSDELHRVMIHGVLHLCGYLDKTPAEKQTMTAREDEALALLSQM